MRVVFMGTPDFAVPSLAAVLRAGHEVAGVCTQPDRPKGRGRTVTASPVKALAVAEGVPVVQPEKMKSPELLRQLSAWRPEVIVVTAFGRMLPKVILDLPPRGCVNVHASLLPKYRGAAPMQWAVMHGESTTGVTTMVMDEGMDTGAVLLQTPVTIDPEETAGALGERLAVVGGALLVDTLARLEAGTVVPCAQDDAQATAAPLLTKDDGLIRWTQSATEIVNRIRGCAPWPGSCTFHHHRRLLVWKGRVADRDASPLLDQQPPGTIMAVGPQSFCVGTGDGVVEVLTVQPDNRARMSAGEFLQGHAVRVGERLTPQPEDAAADRRALEAE